MKQSLGFGCLAFLATATLAATASWFGSGAFFSAREGADVRVVITTRELEDQAQVSGDDLAELPLPARFASPAMISSADAPHLVGLELTETSEGTALTWSHFADHVRARRVRACTEAVNQALEPELTAALERVLAQVRPVTHAEEAPVPRGAVLVLARAVTPGTVLGEGDLTAAQVPAELLTASWIDASRLSEVVGAAVLTKLEPGEPLWWQMLEPANAPPGTLASCVVHVDDAWKQVRQRLAPPAAQAWVEGEATSW